LVWAAVARALLLDPGASTLGLDPRPDLRPLALILALAQNTPWCTLARPRAGAPSPPKPAQVKGGGLDEEEPLLPSPRRPGVHSAPHRRGEEARSPARPTSAPRAAHEPPPSPARGGGGDGGGDLGDRGQLLGDSRQLQRDLDELQRGYKQAGGANTALLEMMAKLQRDAQALAALTLTLTLTLHLTLRLTLTLALTRCAPQSAAGGEAAATCAAGEARVIFAAEDHLNPLHHVMQLEMIKVRVPGVGVGVG
jgi:hypothetical protein